MGIRLFRRSERGKKQLAHKQNDVLETEVLLSN